MLILELLRVQITERRIVARTARRRRYEVIEMYALKDISNQMLEDSAFDMEGEIRGEATEQFAVKEGAEIRGTVRAGQKSCSV